MSELRSVSGEMGRGEDEKGEKVNAGEARAWEGEDTMPLK